MFLLSVVFSLFLAGTASYSFAETNSVDVVENRLVTLVGEGIDADPNDILTYKWVQNDGEPVSLSSYTIAEPTFMAPEVANGQIKVLTFTLTVTDEYGADSSDSVEIVVNPVNHAPIVSAGRDQVTFKTINVITLVSSVVDPDGDALTYSWKQIAGQTIPLTSTTGKYLTILPMHIDYSQTNPLTFELTVNDGFGGVGSDTVSVYPLTGLLDNRLISIQAGPIQTVHEGETVTLSATGQTANGQPISYSWVQLIGTGVSLSAYTGSSVTFTAPELPDETEMMLSFQVTGYSSGNGWANALALVKVIPSNDAPIANAGPDQSVGEKTLVKLIGTATDPDDAESKLRYSWKQTSGMKVDIYEQATFSVYFFTPTIMDKSETLTFELTVVDPSGNSDKDDVNVVVSTVNLPPRANAGPDRKVIGESQVTVTGSGFDPENGPITYAWKQLAGETVTFDTTKPSFSFKAPSVVSGETKRMVFQLTVTDSENQKGTDQLILLVVPENSAPIVDAGVDQVANERTMVDLVCSAYDPDGDATTSTWTSSNPDVIINDPTSLSTSVKLPAVTRDQVITMTCTASDGRLSSSDSMNINLVNTFDLPIVADAGEDRIVNENVKVSLDGSKSNDPEGQKLSYMWKQVSGETVTLSSTSAVNPSFTSPVVANGQVKVLVFELRVFDDNGREGTDSVTITVDPVNAPPEAKATAKQS
ncbi:MAG: peptidase [Nanoarchaeota archaeon]|nr:peptidase [Nanoarchaeota archaeon]